MAQLFLSPFDSVWGGASDECIEVSSRIWYRCAEPLQGFAPSCACVVAVICEIGQPGGWRTPTTALCARRAGASRLPSDGPRPLLPTSTLARGAREAKNRHPSATMEPRSPLLRRASRGGRSPTLSPRVDRRRARVPLVSACAIRMCRGGGLPGCCASFRSAPLLCWEPPRRQGAWPRRLFC